MPVERQDRGVLLALSGDDSGVLRALQAPGSGLVVVRRCADTAELLSAALAGLARLVVIDTGFDDLDRTVLDRLDHAGAAGVLLAPPEEAERWESAGWAVEDLHADPGLVRARLQLVARGLDPAPSPGPAPAPPGADSVAGAGDPAPSGAGEVPPPSADGFDVALWAELDKPRDPGASAGGGAQPGGAAGPGGAGASGAPGVGEGLGGLVVVWGPHGSPDRSVVAASLAHGLAACGGTVLVDADVEAPCLTQLLGLPEDSSALATAARLASRGRLDDEALAQVLVPVASDQWLLSGLGRPGRWRELPPAAMPDVWRQCRRAAAWTVIDVAGGAIDDSVDGYTLEPGRGAVAADLVRSADVVVLVGASDPVSVRRLLQLAADLEEDARPTGRVQVVVNRVRASVAGPAPQRAVREVLARFGGMDNVAVLPEDGLTADQCLMEGRSVLAAAPSSPLGRALADLTDRVDPAAHAGQAARSPRSRLWLRRRRGREVRQEPGTVGASSDGGAGVAGPLAASRPPVVAPPPPPEPGTGGRHRR
ncbi:MAG: hypothetical protein Q4C85_00695 [Actinomyces sp.]|uniref:AAA family ATPase n=1 Tax=Actinomyces sp. TaxID=29317 RepID=UPI0026DD4FA9|nr:hypothetical protein [Actinomyces sp.]MDO4242281.1 hypothetical protein [Actinomyces sp.]